MIVAGGADDAVFRVQERIGALDDVTAAVMLLRGEIAERLCFFGVQIPDGDAAKQRHNGMTVAVKVDGGRSICIRCLIGNVDLWVDAQRQDLIRRVSIVAVMVDVGIALCHVGVLIYLLGVQGFHGQCRRGGFLRRGLYRSRLCGSCRSGAAVRRGLRSAAGSHGKAQGSCQGQA